MLSLLSISCKFVYKFAYYVMSGKRPVFTVFFILKRNRFVAILLYEPILLLAPGCRPSLDPTYACAKACQIGLLLICYFCVDSRFVIHISHYVISNYHFILICSPLVLCLSYFSASAFLCSELFAHINSSVRPCPSCLSFSFCAHNLASACILFIISSVSCS